MYFATVQLPNRRLGDIEKAHDAVDIEIGDNERIIQVDLIEQPWYTQGQKPEGFRDPEGNQRNPMTNEIIPNPRMETVNVRDKTKTSYRLRVATKEEIDYSDASDLPTLPSGEVVDAEVIE
jgi:hypothetical protein